jgi:pantetheine-phosphate adenylyltransferase
MTSISTSEGASGGSGTVPHEKTKPDSKSNNKILFFILIFYSNKSFQSTFTRYLDPQPAITYILAMFKAVFPGSFDPPTLGHLNIIERASLIFDELVVVVADNRQKKYLFAAEERVEMMKEIVKTTKNVRVASWDSLIVDFLKKENIRLLIRGVRGMDDFSYEFELSMMNKAMHPHIETLFMTTESKYIVLRSSSIKELASFNGDVSQMVPALVAEALKKKFPHN